MGLALAGIQDPWLDPDVLVGGVVLLAYAGLRTWRPLALRGDAAGLVPLLVEVAIHVVVVVATGHWDSPFVFSLITAIIVAGFARGFAFALGIGAISALAVAVPFHATDARPVGDALRLTGQWLAELLLIGTVAGYARRFSGEAERREALTLDRLGRMAEANTLLFSLNQVAQSLPASLDLDEALDSIVARLRAFFDLTAVAVILPDETSGGWLVARQEGSRLPQFLGVEELPPAAVHATRASSAVAHESLAEGVGIAERSRSGLYAPLHARGQLVGVLGVEHDTPHRFTRRDVELLDGFTESAALAVDNARWFRRLRSVGADEERTRIARELHDRVGQSLAYLAFELDRLVRHSDDHELRPGIELLRQDLRTVVAEIRETLYDLRTDVSETQGLVETMEQYLDRTRRRTDMDIVFEHDAPERLPLPQEREMWRIAQEAVANAERHAEGSLVRVRWWSDGTRAELEVADDGKGFDMGKAGRMDSYGLLGMRERAAGIGAALRVDSAPGRGTRLTCSLEPR